MSKLILKNYKTGITKSEDLYDLTDYYVDAYVNQDKSKKEHEITLDEIISQFFAIYFAATDTTANWTGQMFYCLGKYPEVQDKVRAEIDQFVKNIDEVDYSLLSKGLPYCSAFLFEVLRYF